MTKINESPKVRETPWATSERQSRGQRFMSLDIICHRAQFAYIKLQFIPRDVVTPAARRILWPMIVSVHRISLHDRPRAQALLSAIVAAADCQSFSGGRR
jgi:hypothetical protein